MEIKSRRWLTALSIGIICCLHPSCKKDAQAPREQPVSTPKLQELKDAQGRVVTPFGHIPSDHVIALDSWTVPRIRNGRLQLIDRPTGKVVRDLGALTAEQLSKSNPYAYAATVNKDTNAAALKSILEAPNPASVNAAATRATFTAYHGNLLQAHMQNIQSFSTKWVVPPFPQERYSNETTFLWNGLDRGTLQPVLMWGATAGGPRYAVANWAFLADYYFHGDYIMVSPGVVLEGLVTYEGRDGEDYVYRVSFTEFPMADIVVNRPWVANDVIECFEPYTHIMSQWPNIEYVTLYDINITTHTGTPGDEFDWFTYAQTSFPTPSGLNAVVTDPGTSDGEMRFYFDGTADNAILPDGNYKIVTALNNSSLLDVEQAGTADFTTVILFAPNSYYSPNQIWNVTYTGEGDYKISPLHAPWMALDVAYAQAYNGAFVGIHQANGSYAQRWRITSTNEGTFRLAPECAPQFALDVNNGTTGNFNKIQIWTTNYGFAQKFKFIPQ